GDLMSSTAAKHSEVSASSPKGEGANARRNVSAIIAMERAAIASRTAAERVSDAIASTAGRMWFVMAHVIWFGVWILINTGDIPLVKAFDPYPYQFLTLVVSLEAIFLSLFILMSQNRSSRQA